MANYYGTCRTNYFEVKDLEAFKADLEKYDLTFIESEESKGGVGFTTQNTASGGLPTWETAEADEAEDTEVDWDEDAEIDWKRFFRRHLVDDSVAIVAESGAEKYRYIVGYTLAYTNKGLIHSVSLEDIYAMVRKDAKLTCTDAAY